MNSPCCHDDGFAPGQGTGHLVTAQECDVCHTTNSWLGAVFDHSGVSGNCVSCHDGSIATGTADVNHLPLQSPQVCEACHSGFVDWSVVASAVDHNEVLGTCSSCHDDGFAPGQGTGRLVTAQECGRVSHHQ